MDIILCNIKLNLMYFYKTYQEKNVFKFRVCSLIWWKPKSQSALYAISKKFDFLKQVICDMKPIFASKKNQFYNST